MPVQFQNWALVEQQSPMPVVHSGDQQSGFASFFGTLTFFFLIIISFPCHIISAGHSSTYSQSSSSSHSFSFRLQICDAPRTRRSW
ncbi:hypothetical protein CICLE_v10017532mg [Citrus x clementina]|uniref:Uncharacterized protein n=2 Tax=Citrus TaxID=2706 RepID=V4U8L3_CITCL|nr:hypothetical protein CICLE_v10017532mg [Citrus x clementina]GAY33534.1 hypothetical protein CUMW_275410 [Citrus unshiu]